MGEKVQHTPGPWRVASQGMGPNHAVFSDHGFVCDANGPDHAPANARLIAAAPDLLAALEAVVAKLELWPGDKSPEGFACMKQARAALVKARGEAQG